MNIIKEDDFNNLLELSKLEVVANEREIMIKDICSLLSWVKALEEVDTKDVPPLIHPSHDSISPSKDIPIVSLPHTDVLLNAPSKNLNYIVIPKVK